MLGLLVLAGVAVSSPDVVARSSAVCDRAMTSVSGRRYFRDPYDWSDPRRTMEDMDRREVAFWQTWSGRAVTEDFSPEEMRLARRICETKVISYLNGRGEELEKIKVATNIPD